MEEQTTTTPQLGTWGKLPTEEMPRLPKVDFEVGEPVEVTFTENEPVELTGDKGVYYLFHVKVGEEDKVMMSGAWSLLRALKIQSPLKDKTIKITKKLINGKQQYFVGDDSENQTPEIIPASQL